MLNKIINFLKKIFNKKIKIIIFYSFLIALLISFIFFFIYWPRDMSKGVSPIYGLNFSQKYATDLGLNWRETYIQILDDLKPERLRISSNWNLVEKRKGRYNFKDLDWQIKEAQKRNINIILAIGRRTPRWPECHTPFWAKQLSEKKQDEFILGLLKKEVNHFKKFPNIIYWQVENEPFLNIFGECPDGNENFLDKEINLVKSLDNRKIMLTDSGELSSWRKLAKKSDILGISLYRTVQTPHWGLFTYPFLPTYYYYKAKIIKHFNKNLEKIIISELQGEAWSNTPLPTITIKKQYHSMDIKKLKNNIKYAHYTGLNEIYIWGAEWWYWLKSRGDDSFWQTAKNILISNQNK